MIITHMKAKWRRSKGAFELTGKRVDRAATLASATGAAGQGPDTRSLPQMANRLCRPRFQLVIDRGNRRRVAWVTAASHMPMVAMHLPRSRQSGCGSMLKRHVSRPLSRPQSWRTQVGHATSLPEQIENNFT
jgi:hypothetical protein